MLVVTSFPLIELITGQGRNVTDMLRRCCSGESTAGVNVLKLAQILPHIPLYIVNGRFNLQQSCKFLFLPFTSVF